MNRLCVLLLLYGCASANDMANGQSETGGSGADATGGNSAIYTGGANGTGTTAATSATGSTLSTGGAQTTGGRGQTGGSATVAGGSGTTSTQDCKAPAPYDYESCYAYGLGKWMCLDGVCTDCGAGALDCDRDPSNYCEINDAANLKVNNCCAAEQIGHDYALEVENCL